MGSEPSWYELLLTFALAAALPTVVGGAIILSLVGLTVWATAPLRRRRRATEADGEDASGARPEAGGRGG